MSDSDTSTVVEPENVSEETLSEETDSDDEATDNDESEDSLSAAESAATVTDPTIATIQPQDNGYNVVFGKLVQLSLGSMVEQFVDDDSFEDRVILVFEPGDDFPPTVQNARKMRDAFKLRYEAIRTLSRRVKDPAALLAAETALAAANAEMAALRAALESAGVDAEAALAGIREATTTA